MPVDRALVVATLAARLRLEGVRVPLSATQTLARVLTLTPAPPPYWAARLTLVSSHRELRIFDDVWADLVAHRVAEPEGPRPEGPETIVTSPERPRREAAGAASEQAVPWTPRRTVTAASDETGESRSSAAPLLRPSAQRHETDLSFEALDPDRLRHLDEVLRAEMVRWPRRRTRREHHRGVHERIDMRRTVSRARRTGWETVVLEHRGRTARQRRTVVLTDVSQSMQPYATAYLHLMRVLTRRGGAEAFAFGTGLYRLTPALERHGPADAVREASRSVTDRFGGTRIATSLRQLMSSHHGELLRGAVCIIASDGWDSDPPEEVAAQMARLRRRAHRVVWLNPRAAVDDFEPRVRSMAAAAPYCDEVLPARTIDDLPAVMRCVGQFQSVT